MNNSSFQNIKSNTFYIIIFLLFIFRLIVLKTSGYIVASVMSQNEKEEIPFGISSFSSYKKD